MDHKLQRALEPIYKKYGLGIGEGNTLVTHTFASLASHLLELEIEDPTDLPPIKLIYLGNFTPFVGKPERWPRVQNNRRKLIKREIDKITKVEGHESRRVKNRRIRAEQTKELMDQRRKEREENG